VLYVVMLPAGIALVLPYTVTFINGSMLIHLTYILILSKLSRITTSHQKLLY